MNTAMLWKDWRDGRPVMIFGVVALALPYFAVCCHRLMMPWLRNDLAMPSWGETLPAVAAASMMLCVLWLAVAGGTAVAGERQNGAAEFMAALPVSRSAMLFSRAAVVLLAMLVAFALNIGVYLWSSALDVRRHVTAEPAEPLLTLTASGVLVFGIAWLFSCILRSPTIATCAGIVAPIFLGGVVWGYAWLTDPSFWTVHEPPAEMWYNIGAMSCGLGAFVLGSLHFVRRVVP